MILQSILKKSIQSILKKENVSESFVSRYEKHFDSSRQSTEEHSLAEMIIAENVPLLHHADEILERAMNQCGLQTAMVNDTFCVELTTYIHIPEKLLEQKSKLRFM